MLNIIFTEASLELVPKEIMKHPSVKRNAKRRKKPPEETLLERSLHHYAMEHILDSHKRGRPDILHFCLLLAMGSPLNRQEKLRVYINTLNNQSIQVNSALRPPRDCFRFNRLMEQLFINGSVPPQSQEPLMSLKQECLKNQLNRISPSMTLALSSHGKPSNFKKVASMLSQEKSPAIIIGAYPRGSMNSCVLRQADEVFSVYPEPLEAWTITSRIIYEFEKVDLSE